MRQIRDPRALFTLAAVFMIGALLCSLLSGCAYWNVEHSYFADGHSVTSVTEIWCCTERPKAGFESRREYVPEKGVVMRTEMLGMHASMQADSGRAP